jgi:hypothetical protein
MNKALVDTQTNLVDNVIVAPEPGSTWTPPEGHIVVDLVGEAGIGWKYIDGQFIPPPVPPAPEPPTPPQEIPVTEV